MLTGHFLVVPVACLQGNLPIKINPSFPSICPFFWISSTVIFFFFLFLIYLWQLSKGATIVGIIQSKHTETVPPPEEGNVP